MCTLARIFNVCSVGSLGLGRLLCALALCFVCLWVLLLVGFVCLDFVGLVWVFLGG